MSDYTLTDKGAEWLINRIISKKYAGDIDTVYVVYTNSDTYSINLGRGTSIKDLMDKNSQLWCLKKDGGVIGYTTNNTNGAYTANLSCTVTKNDVVSGDGVPLISGVSRIIAVAIAVSDDPENIIAACKVGKSDAPVFWVDNMPLSVACPICINSYPLETR